MMLEQRADCYREMGQTEKAAADYREALATWDVADYPIEQAAAIAIRRGIIEQHLGQPGMEARFKEALRLNPERRSSFAEILSHLVIIEDLDMAVAFYRLAFNQDQLDAMWKIYFAIWVEGLSLRKTGESFGLARGYLENVEGKDWQQRLAMFFTGRLDSRSLREAARNRGQEVEADYYEALLLLTEGKPEESRALLDAVIASDLVAFSEYRMARELLRNGIAEGGKQ